MDVKDIKKYIDNDVPRVRHINQQVAYYEGKHPGILFDLPKEEPDNRVPVPIIRAAINFLLGYMFPPGSITYTGEYYDSTLKDTYNSNEEGILNSEMAKTALITGRAYEAHWTEDGAERFAQVPITQGIMVKSSDLVPRDLAFIRYWKDDKSRLHAWVYEPGIVNIYTEGKFGLELDTNVIDGEGNKIVNPIIQGYKTVSVLEATINSDGSNLFDHVLELQDLLDRGLSEDIANELQRFANAYLLLGVDLDSTHKDEKGLTDLDKIKFNKIFTNLGESVRDKVAFLEKNINPEFINTALDRIERLVWEMIGVINPNDDSFKNAVSGTALAYRLLPFEYLCAGIETYFGRFLQRRVRLVGALDSTINGTAGPVADVVVKFSRNLPANETEKIDNALKLSTLVSKETMLEYLPGSVVDSAEDEMKRGDEESGGIGDMEDEAALAGAGIATDGNVANTALNGAQVTSLVDVCTAVAEKTLPVATAMEILLIAFPTISREEAQAMLGPLKNFEPKKPEPVIPFGGRGNNLPPKVGTVEKSSSVSTNGEKVTPPQS